MFWFLIILTHVAHDVIRFFFWFCRALTLVTTRDRPRLCWALRGSWILNHLKKMDIALDQLWTSKLFGRVWVRQLLFSFLFFRGFSLLELDGWSEVEWLSVAEKKCQLMSWLNLWWPPQLRCCMFVCWILVGTKHTHMIYIYIYELRRACSTKDMEAAMAVVSWTIEFSWMEKMQLSWGAESRNMMYLRKFKWFLEHNSGTPEYKYERFFFHKEVIESLGNYGVLSECKKLPSALRATWNMTTTSLTPMIAGSESHANIWRDNNVEPKVPIHVPSTWNTNNSSRDLLFKALVFLHLQESPCHRS